MKTLFIHAKSNEAVLPVVEKAAKLLPKKIGLVSTIQHAHKLKDAKKLLEKKGKKVFIAGSVLGCDVSNAKKTEKKVDAFLYIGSGEFHRVVRARRPSTVSTAPRSEVRRVDHRRKPGLHLDQPQGLHATGGHPVAGRSSRATLPRWYSW